MAKAVAKKGDQVVGLDTHVILVPSSGGPIPTPMPHSFSGAIEREVSTSVFIDNQPVALVGSVADCMPPHIPMGGPFQRSPSNEGTVARGAPPCSSTACRRREPAIRECCNDPVDQDTGHVIATGSVFAS